MARLRADLHSRVRGGAGRIAAMVCRRLGRQRGDERGSALVIVMLLVAVLAGLGPIMVSQINGDSGLLTVATEQRAALQAANAGIQWYENNLNTVANYYQSPPASDPALGNDASGQPKWCSSACGLPASSPQESFHYTPSNTSLYSLHGASAGEQLLTVTGRAGVTGNYQYVTLMAGFRRSSILNNAYFSNYELLDPSVVKAYADSGAAGFNVTVGSGRGATSESEFDVTVSYGGQSSESLWQAACEYYTYQPNAFIDSLGNVTTGLGSPRYFSSAYPYYGPFYGSVAGQSYGPSSFTFTNGNQQVTVPDSICSQPFEFISADQFLGPVYTEDQLHICGNPSFQGQPVSYTSSASATSDQYGSEDLPGSVLVPPNSTGLAGRYPSEPNQYYAPNGYVDDCNDQSPPTIAHGGGGYPVLGGTQAMPQTNTELQSLAAANGCVFTGPTMIELVTVNGTTTMDVWSPLSSSSAPTPPSAACSTGKDATGKSVSGFSTSSPFITGLPLPSNGAVYVENAAATSNGVSVPDCTDASYSDTTTSNCTAGDAFVEGELSGELTIASAANIIITRDISYACADNASGANGPASTANPASVSGCTNAASPDVLGLDAGGDVILSRPNGGGGYCSYDGTGSPGTQTNVQPAGVWPTCNPGALSSRNPSAGQIIIDAAVVATQGSFGVQSYDQGNPDGTVYLNGADVSDFRGPFGTFSGSTIDTGDAKGFSFDNRLAYLAPPGMLNISGASWNVVSTTSCGNVNSSAAVANSVPSCPSIP